MGSNLYGSWWSHGHVTFSGIVSFPEFSLRFFVSLLWRVGARRVSQIQRQATTTTTLCPPEAPPPTTKKEPGAKGRNECWRRG